MKDVLQEITKLRLKRNWSEYELAKNSGLTQSTISTWYYKVCKGFGITLSQFFAENDDAISLTEEQKNMLDNWSALNPKQKQIIMELLQNMH